MRLVRRGFTRPLCAALTALILLACIPPCAAQEDQGPRFFRCTVVGDHFIRIMDNDAAQGAEIWLHGSVPTGTEVELLALDGSERNSTVVPYDSGFIYENGCPGGKLPMTQIPLEAGQGLGPLAVAVTPVGLTYEDLALAPVSGGSMPRFLEQWKADLAAGECWDGLCLDQRSEATAYLHAEMDKCPLDLLLVSVPPCPAFPGNQQFLLVFTGATAQSFAMGHEGTYKFFLLHGTLYLATDFPCWTYSCDNDSGYSIHAFEDGAFVPVYENMDWSSRY